MYALLTYMSIILCLFLMLSWPRKELLDRLGPKKSVQAPVSERGRAEKALQGVASFRLALTALSCAPLPPAGARGWHVLSLQPANITITA